MSLPRVLSRPLMRPLWIDGFAPTGDRGFVPESGLGPASALRKITYDRSRPIADNGRFGRLGETGGLPC